MRKYCHIKLAGKFKILITEPEGFNEEALSILRSYAIVDLKKIEKKDLEQVFQENDAIWLRLGSEINRDIIGESSRCRYIITAVTGTDHIDEEFCKAQGIKVISLKGEKEFLKEVRATAELTIALTLALLRKIVPASCSVLMGEWDRDKFRGNELYGKTAGIIGVGRLGKITSAYFKAFGMKVLGFDPNKDGFEGEYTNSLEDLIRRSDVVSLHANYNREEDYLIGEKEFSYFKPGSIFINTSRGGLIDETSLLKALTIGQIKGAALDVIKDELKFNLSNKLVEYAQKNENLLIVPHIGGNTFESFEKTEKFMAEKLLKILKHDEKIN